MGLRDLARTGQGASRHHFHERLIFKRISGHIIHMSHPMQSNLVETAENNMNILNQLRNDIGDINQI